MEYLFACFGHDQQCNFVIDELSARALILGLSFVAFFGVWYGFGRYLGAYHERLSFPIGIAVTLTIPISIFLVWNKVNPEEFTTEDLLFLIPCYTTILGIIIYAGYRSYIFGSSGK